MLPASEINAAFAIEQAMVGRIRQHKKPMTDEQVMIGLFQRIECRNDAWFSNAHSVGVRLLSSYINTASSIFSSFSSSSSALFTIQQGKQNSLLCCAPGHISLSGHSSTLQ